VSGAARPADSASLDRADGRRALVRVGLISDTHGLLRPQALAALRGSDYVIHAGDIGNPAILDRLREIAPLTAVRGNNDVAEWAHALPETAVLDVHGVRILVLHDVNALRGRKPQDVHAVVSGHSHRPASTLRDGVLYVNPGSAGPRRFSLPISMGELHVEGTAVSARLIDIPP
jgi:uncharacterized protein